MPTTGYVINGQRDLIAVVASIELNCAISAPSDYTLTLARNVRLGGDIELKVRQAGSRLIIDGNGSGYAAPVPILSGTVELAWPDAGSLGVIAFVSQGGVLRIDGTVMPANPISLRIQLATINLVGIATAAMFTNLAPGPAIDIPVLGGGNAFVQGTVAIRW